MTTDAASNQYSVFRSDLLFCCSNRSVFSMVNPILADLYTSRLVMVETEKAWRESKFLN